MPPDMSTPTAPVCGSPGAPACPTSAPTLDSNYGTLCGLHDTCTAPDTKCEYLGNGVGQCLSTCNSGVSCPDGTICSNNSYALCLKTCSSDSDCSAGNVCFTVPPDGDIPGARVCAPDSLVSGSGGGTGTGGGTGSGGGSATGGGSGAGGGAPAVNQAEVLWKAQEDVYQTSEKLRSTWGDWLIGWLRNARTAAGASGNVTTGTLTETASGSFTYSPGGQSLRIVKANGFSFSITVQQLVGSVASTSFPSGSDHAVGIFDMGSYSMKVDITEKTAAFDGDDFDDAGERFTAHVRQTKDESSFYGNGTYWLENNETFSGTVARGDALVSYSTKKWLYSCTGTGCSSSSMTLDIDHDVTVSLPSGDWKLVYSTGFTQPSGALAKYTWHGDISSGSTVVGGLAKRKVGTISELNVFVGADLYRVRTVTEP